jgi:hypothetical protein
MLPSLPDPTPLDTLIERLALLEQAVVPGSDAALTGTYTQEGTPYWTNTVTGWTTETVSEDLQVITYRITMELVLGATTEGYEQQAERQVQKWIPTITQYFGKRRNLKRTSADAGVRYLDSRGAQITDGRVNYNLGQSGIGQSMFGIAFNIEVPMDQDTEQAVF